MTDEPFREWGDLARRVHDANEAVRGAPDPSSTQWAGYIHSEVRAACTRLRWGNQVRRKWSERETPLLSSEVDDYEWKLIPNANGKLPELPATDRDEGTYDVLSLDHDRERFVLDHSTFHDGAWGLPRRAIGCLAWLAQMAWGKPLKREDVDADSIPSQRVIPAPAAEHFQGSFRCS
jgi:hypothetical protein